ncbi:MAG: hypothetical protein A2328_01895, partial [Bdellovibrionales bacterium RIFOXYB2_FULL_36_6]
SAANEENPFKRQSANNEGKWGNCIFTFNPLEENYDWLVIIDDVAKVVHNRIEVLKCPKENTILVTTEPSSISRYGRGFAKQFHYLITNQDANVLPHPNALRSQTGNIWMYGEDYDTMKLISPMQKTKKISTICSNKQQGHTGHQQRYIFTQILEQEIPTLGRFGRGFKWIDKKSEALDDYEFHVAIENHIGEHVWTEKLADAFLGYTVPIYCGCSNVYDYFPKNSLIQIDVSDIQGSIKQIKEIIEIEGEYERRFEAVKEARRKVLEEYNLLAMINKIVENAENATFQTNQKIYSRRLMRVRYLPDLFRYFGFRIKNLFKNF